MQHGVPFPGRLLEHSTLQFFEAESTEVAQHCRLSLIAPGDQPLDEELRVRQRHLRPVRALFTGSLPLPFSKRMNVLRLQFHRVSADWGQDIATAVRGQHLAVQLPADQTRQIAERGVGHAVVAAVVTGRRSQLLEGNAETFPGLVSSPLRPRERDVPVSGPLFNIEVVGAVPVHTAAFHTRLEHQELQQAAGAVPVADDIDVVGKGMEPRGIRQQQLAKLLQDGDVGIVLHEFLAVLNCSAQTTQQACVQQRRFGITEDPAIVDAVLRHKPMRDVDVVDIPRLGRDEGVPVGDWGRIGCWLTGNMHGLIRVSGIIRGEDISVVVMERGHTA
mmetsp:Transcript_36779/g.68411  ORF Transcript_36779/g.68411 Transcript_36779/m.68411 type:complete len:332 (+) Transcript_36779:291-1286(+)